MPLDPGKIIADVQTLLRGGFLTTKVNWLMSAIADWSMSTPTKPRRSRLDWRGLVGLRFL